MRAQGGAAEHVQVRGAGGTRQLPQGRRLELPRQRRVRRAGARAGGAGAAGARAAPARPRAAPRSPRRAALPLRQAA